MNFPVDDVTLAMLAESCRCDNDDGQSHLFDFLDFGAVEESRAEIAPGVVEVVYEPGRAPWSPQAVIVALVAEIQRLRGECE